MRRFVSIAVLILLCSGGISLAGVRAQEPSLLDFVPTAGELGSTFLVEHRLRTLDEQATGFADADEAATMLAEWGWQANAFAVFQSNELTATGAPAATIDISLTRFASSAGAAEAMPYFVQDRAAVLGQDEVTNLSAPRIGDETRALAGDVDGGFDDTLYVRAGPLLLRVSATSAAGAPTVSPPRIAQAIIDRTGTLTQPVLLAQPAEYLPYALPLSNADCFRVDGEGELDVAGVVERLAVDTDVVDTLEALGWQGGAFRQFACDPPPGSPGWVDLSVHHFADAEAAAEAVALFAASRAQGMRLQPAKVMDVGDSRAAIAGTVFNGTEYTLYMSRGPLLFAVTGVAPAGDPQADVERIAAALSDLTLETPAETASAPTPQVQVLAQPTATVTPLPTPIPAPTVAPLPTPSPTAIPTAVPTAMPIAPPTTIPVMIPTAPPLEPAVGGPLPTPTPRVIHPPETG